MEIQRLRNLTTGRLHTKIGHVHEDIGFLTGAEGVMTHQIPNATSALKPWLKEKVTPEIFWNGEFDQDHTGDFQISPMTEADRAEFMQRFFELDHPSAEKPIIPVMINNQPETEEK